MQSTIFGEVPRHYAASILHLDDALGRIVAAIDKAGKRDNTLIIFTSENGGSTAENNDTKYPNEEQNLAVSQPGKIATLRKKLEAAAANDRDAVAQSE